MKLLSVVATRILLTLRFFSAIGHSGQYSDVLNPPTRVSQFSNDSNYAFIGQKVSEFVNDSNYAVIGQKVSEFANDAQYTVNGSNVSQFANNSNYAVRGDSFRITQITLCVERTSASS